MSTNATDNNPQNSLDSMTDDARSLIAATADAADEKVVQARNRLNATLDAARETYAAVKKKTVEGAQAADEMIREKPYHALGVAFAIGAVIGFLVSRRNRG